MELIDLVSELLYENNCVIIPGFGGFVGNFKSTDFNEGRLLASPNRKRVAFNESLNENDGLLIDALRKRKSISYDQAQHEVEIFAKFLKDRLLKYKNYEFKHLGSLYLNKEDKLIFVAYDGSNFHKKSYGLQDVKVKRLIAAPKVVKPQPAVTPAQQPVVQSAPKIVPIEQPTSTRRRRFYIPQIAASVAVLSIFALMIWQILHTNAKEQMSEQKPGTEQEASFLPDDTIIPIKSKDTIVVTREIPVTAKVADEIPFVDVTPEKEVSQQKPQELTPNKKTVSPTVKSSNTKKSTTKTSSTKTNQKSSNRSGKTKTTAQKSKKETQPKETPKTNELESKSNTSDKVASAMERELKSYTETYYYVAVAKDYDSKTEEKKTKKLTKHAYDVYEKQSGNHKYLCIERFISKKNAKDFLYLVKKYDDKDAFIIPIEE